MWVTNVDVTSSSAGHHIIMQFNRGLCFLEASDLVSQVVDEAYVVYEVGDMDQVVEIWFEKLARFGLERYECVWVVFIMQERHPFCLEV